MRFSIIIPAHNAEQRIVPLLESIEKQTFKDYELIVVCDACTDGTDEVCSRYNARMFSVDAHNCAVARNKGLDEARGEYVLFADDDDHWIHPFALEQIDRELNYSKDATADMIQCAFVYGKHGVTPITGRIYPNVWSKIWKRSAIGLTRFPPDRFPADDLGFTLAMLDKGVTVGFATILWYYYEYPREGSIMWKQEHEGRSVLPD